MPAEPIVQRASVLDYIALGRSDNVYLLVGAPGTGKSEIARQAARAFGAGYTHWCDAQDDRTLSPLRFVNSLALALADRYPDYAECLVREVRPDIFINATVEVQTLESGARAQAVAIESLQVSDMPPRAAFDRLIRLPLEGVQGDREPFLVVVDAIDESLGFHPTAHLVDLLAHAGSCPGLGFVLTSRSGESRVTDRLGAASLDLDHHTDGDLLEYARLRLGNFSDPDRLLLAERLAGTCNFLYVRHVLNDLGKLPLGTDITALAMPESLSDVYRQFLTRTLAPDRRDPDWVTRYRPVLGIVAVGRGQDGIPVSLIAAAAGLSPSATMDVLLACGQFIRMTGKPPDDFQARVYHRSFQDFLLTDDTFTVFPAEAHAAIAQALGTERWRSWTTEQRTYGLSYLPLHLNEGGPAASLITLARDQDFLAAQRQRHPEDPSIDVTTMRLALRAACAGSDPVLVADLLLALSARLDVSDVKTPRQILESHGLAAALAATRELDADLRAANELLLCLTLIESEKHDEARHLAGELLARNPDRLTSRVEGGAALMLAIVCQLLPELGQSLAARVLDTWSLMFMVKHLLDLRDHRSAVRVASCIRDWEPRYLTFFCMGEYLLNRGEIDEAVALLDIVGESVDPDNSPPPDCTYWPIFATVVRVVSLSLIMKGDVQRGLAVSGPKNSPQQENIRVPQLQAAAGFAAWRAGDQEGARRALTSAETQAGELGDDQEARAHTKAIAWAFIGKVYLWCGLREDARRAAAVASGFLPPLAAKQNLPYYGSPVHDDAFHGSCIQGTYLDLACLAGRARDVPTAMALATTLAEYGSPDAVEAFAVAAAAPEASADEREHARQEAARVIADLDATAQVATTAHLAWGIPENDWQGIPFDSPLTPMLDKVFNLQQENSDTRELPVQQMRTGVPSDGAPRLTTLSEDSNLDEGPSMEQLRITPDESIKSGDSAWDRLARAERTYGRALAWARVGGHEEAMRQFGLAESLENLAHSAWESFQALAGTARKTATDYAIEYDEVESQRVRRLCTLASAAARADDRQGITAFLAEAETRMRQIGQASIRASTAADIATTAARCDALSDLAAMLPMISFERPQSFNKIWLSYCDAHAGQVSMVLPAEVQPLLTEISRSPEATVSACAGLATLYPAHAAVISGLAALGIANEKRNWPTLRE